METSGKKADSSQVSSVVLEIMIALADGEKHGYGVMLEVERRTGGAVKLRPGSLYRAINRMVESGWVEEADERSDAEHDDARRRYYRLTRAGRRVAGTEAERLASIVAAAQDKHLMGKGT